MIKCSSLRFLVCSLVFCLNVMGGFTQNNDSVFVKAMYAKIAKYKAADSFVLYYKELDSLGRWFVETEKPDSLYRLSKYYNYLPSNKGDSFIYRRNLYLHAKRFKNLNDYQEALKYFLKSSSYVNNFKTDSKVWFCENPIGAIYARLNDYDKAIQYYKLCIPYLKSKEDYGKLARLYKEIGRSYMWLGQINQMENYFNEGIEFGLKSEEHKGLQAIYSAWAEFNLYYDTIANRLKNFNINIRESIKFMDKLKDESDYLDRAFNLDILMGEYYHELKLFEKANSYYISAIRKAEQIYTRPKSREIAKIYQKLALSNLEQNNREKANVYIILGFKKLIPDFKGGGLPGEKEIDHENTFVSLLELKSMYYRQKYYDTEKSMYLDSALLALDLALDANKQLDSDLILHNSKYMSIASNKQIINTAVGICFEAYKINQKQDYLNKMRSYFDLSKSLLLKENQSRLASKKSMGKDDRILVESLENKLVFLYQKLSDDEQKDKIEQEIVITTEKLKTTHDKHTKSKPKQIPVEGPWIEYVMTDSQTYVMTNIGPNAMYSLGESQKLEASIDKMNQLLQGGDIELLHATLDDLYQVLIPVDLNGILHLKIIPDGKTAFVPFDILRKNNRYLLEDLVLSLAFHHKQPDYVLQKKWFHNTLIIKPDYPEAEVPVYASVVRGNLSKLPFAAVEIEQIKDRFDSWYKVKESIDIPSLGKLLKRHNIFHFAGHAVVRGDSSYLAMTDESGNVFNLTDQLLYTMSHNLDLVTLSACETGLGTYKQGEGVRSLAGSFLNAGAQSIVYSLWQADDQSTSTIMSSFYAHLNAGMKKDDALAQAKKDFLKTCSPDQRHPYYWAGFVIAGNTDPVNSILSKNQLFGAIGLVLLLILYLFFHVKIKTK